MKEINNEKNNKLLAARDVILAYLIKENFTLEECDQVMTMCVDEINAAVKRQKLSEVRKEDE